MWRTGLRGYICKDRCEGRCVVVGVLGSSVCAVAGILTKVLLSFHNSFFTFLPSCCVPSGLLLALLLSHLSLACLTFLKTHLVLMVSVISRQFDPRNYGN